MIVTILDRSEGSLDSYGDPVSTWLAYDIDASSLHPYRPDKTRRTEFGRFRGAMYQLTFDSYARNIQYVDEAKSNRLIPFNSEQYEIVVKENWMDFMGNIIRIYVIIGKCADVVSYGWG